ncbi:hypothetical protein AYI68_g6856 [Smittium mucronatum]|uniref:Inhibitor I9 domain-containing protein n=1 Tax=Smittium mucronatum TaxID=133383 RepID=A0A1R0GPB4_9FUNG|nr:hypothetical protein AYI68_g7234 [Smittium mucronatum]OLY79083.1 hypothetical protein AYI68_g6856 [Smittium mucronatum]
MAKYIVVFNAASSESVKSSTISKIESLGGSVINHLSIINGVSIDLPESSVSDLEADENVKYVEKDSEVHIN